MQWRAKISCYFPLQTLSSNPDVARQVIGQNPLFADNPALQEQMVTMLPNFLNQMQNPEMQTVLTNPQVR